MLKSRPFSRLGLRTSTKMKINITVNITNNSSNSSPTAELTENITERSVRLSFYVATFLLGMVGNVLVMVILGKKNKRSIHEMFIFNLAVSDLTFIAFCLPVNGYELFEMIPKIEFFCRFVFLMQTITYFTSIYTITSMAIHRCYVIVNPYKPKMSTKSASVWIAFIWLISLIIVIPIAVVNRSVNDECQENWLDPYHAKVYTAALFVLQFLLPLCIIAIAYIWIGIYLVKNKGPQTSIGGKRRTASHQKKRKENKQIITTLAAIVVLFTICLLPGQIAWMVRDFGTPKEQNDIAVVFKFSDILDFIHACVNPIIYGLLTDKFRKDYKDILAKIFTCGKTTVAPGTSDSTFQMEASNNSGRCVNLELPSDVYSVDIKGSLQQMNGQPTCIDSNHEDFRL